MGEGLDFTKAESRMIGAIMKASRTVPDEIMCVEMVQELACLMCKVEPLLTSHQMATLMGCAAFIAREGNKEMKAQIDAAMLMARIRGQG